MKKQVLALSLLIAIAGCKKDIKTGETTPQQENPGTRPVTEAVTSTANFKGVNWADPRDNFADDWLVLSGLSSSNSNATVQSITNTIVNGFQSAGANTVRMPVNPPTVTQSWWNAYKGAIDKAASKGMKVILAYWEGSSSRNGTVDNMTQFWQMWDVLVNAYQGNANIYFEVMNEPHGYSVTNLRTLYADFLNRYPSLTRERIVLDGAGYATNTNDIGSDSRFNNCILSFHMYTWFDNSRNNTADWERSIRGLNYPGRTIVTEFGAPMTTGKDYLGAPGSDREKTYIQGMTNAMRDLGVGGVYWPGLRDGDSYSMFTFNGSTVSTTNSGGLSRLKYAWNNISIDQPYGSFNSSSFYKVINKNSGKGVDVSGASTADGANIIQWGYSGGNNQQWKFTSTGSGYFTVTNRNSNKRIDINGSSTTPGATAIQWSANTGNNQQWRVIDKGFGYYELINRNSQHALDVNGASTSDGSNIIQWNWNAGNNQLWQIANP